MKRFSSPSLIGCVLSLLLGAALAGLRSESRNDASAETSTPEAIALTSQQTPNPRAQTSDADEALAQALQKENGAKRWLLVLSAAENATASDMPGLIRVAGKDPAMCRMLAARWAELDPRDMFHWVVSESLLPDDAPNALPNRWILGDVLFEDWTKRDVNGVIKALTDVPNFRNRDSLRMTVSNNIMKVDVEQGLRAMQQWGIRNYLPDMSKVADWAARDPRHAAEVITKMGGELAVLESLKEVGKAWAKSSPTAGLEFAATLDPAARATLGAEIMRIWAEKDIAAAAAAATAQSDPAFRGALSQGLMKVWGKSDPAAALAWSQENLRGAARTEAIGGLVKAAAEKNLRTASELVADMAPGAAQNFACASIFETWFNKGEGERAGAFEWLASLPDSAAQHAALERVQWNWAWKEPEAVREFVTGPYGKLASPSLVFQVARGQAAKDPEAAMQWANKLPADRVEQAQQAVLDQWLNVRPEGAMEYIRGLSNGPARERAVQSVSTTLAFQAPQQLATWYGTLPASDQKLVREMIERVGISPEQRTKLKQSLSLP